MTWPSESDCKRICSLWALAHGSANRFESANAFAALKRKQADLCLSDTALAFIGESRVNSDGASDQPLDVLRLILGLFDVTHIIFSLFERAIAVALWVLHSHVFDRFLHTPRLLLQSPEPECGKTALLSCLEQLTSEAFYSSSTSPAAIYYLSREQPRTTLLLDEIENSSLWGRDRLLLNVFDNGHRQGGRVTRVIQGEVVRFPCFAPLALAGVSKYRFPAQLLTRSIVVDMEKHSEGRDELWPDDPRFARVRAFISEWASNFKRPQDSRVPFTGRTADNWRPLIQIAETLGYGETARAAALAIHQPSDDPVVRLLFDIHRVFEQRRIDRVWTSELLKALHELGDAKWDEFWGLNGDDDPHELQRPELYRLLRTKNIRSCTVWKPTDKGAKATRDSTASSSNLFGTSFSPTQRHSRTKS
jgi:hypothetical protein